MSRFVASILSASLMAAATAFAAEQPVSTEQDLPALSSASSDQQTITTENQADRTNKFKPIVMPFYDPSIKTGIMAVPLYAFYPDDNDLVSDASTIAVPLIYTSNKSYIAKVAADIILMEDKLRIVTEGGRTSTNLSLLENVDTNKEEWSFEGDVFYRLFEDFYAGVGLNYRSTRYTADEAGQQQNLEKAGFYGDYNDDTGLRFGLKWDTREHYYYPHGGFVWDLKYETHADWLGNDSDQTYSSVFTDFRHFYSIENDSNKILATKVVGRYLIDAENAPTSAFSTYGRQGKEVQRGFVLGDYISSNMLNLETEYRHRLTETGNEYLDRSTVVGIAGVGKSFGTKIDRTEESFTDSDWLGVVGVGCRFNVLPYERINLKVDVTINTDGDVITYFGVGESI